MTDDKDKDKNVFVCTYNPDLQVEKYLFNKLTRFPPNTLILWMSNESDIFFLVLNDKYVFFWNNRKL